MKRIVVYGAGGNFIDFAPWLKERYEIVAIVDGDKSKIGKKIEGVLIEYPSAIKEKEYDYVVITPNYGEEIESYLKKEYQVPDSKIRILEEMVYDESKTNTINICFILVGGLGDAIINYDYIYCFYRRFSDLRIKIDVANASKAFKEFVGDSSVIADYAEAGFERTEYDVIIEIRRYPRVVRAEYFRIAKIATNLLDYLFILKKYEFENPERIHFGPKNDGYRKIQRGDIQEKRYTQPDIYGEIGLTDVYSAPVVYDRKLLRDLDIVNEKFITIHRGCDKTFFSTDNVKLWKENNYEELIVLIKQRYQDYQVILLGEEYERSERIKSYDLDLLGKTSVSQLKAVLRYSSLHIDTEGGLVHMRHALNGGTSIVIFGPTSDKFFGYPENINIRIDSCPDPCEWKTKDWAVNCSNSVSRHCCMESITPQMVMANMEKVFSKL